jgi:pimeloyl-ACP methyl ester carboxylesterase
MRTSGERIIEANGVALCVESFGSPGAPAILLIHGAGSSMVDWDDALCERLAAAGRGRLVIRYDSRDAGRSVTYEAGAPPYSSADLVADVVGLLDALDLPAAHLAGMSGGGVLAQLVALDHPDRVASLTLASSSPGDGRPRPALPGMSDELRAFFAGALPEPDWGDRDAAIEYLVNVERPFAARSRPFDEGAARARAARKVDRTSDLAANLTNPFMIETGPPPRMGLGDLRTPTLVIHGTEDPLFGLAHGEALAQETGGELLALPATGHEYFPRHTWDTVVPAILRHTDVRKTLHKYDSAHGAPPA